MNFLERAIELAERGRGTTQPNPVVGAVLVRDGELVGEGWHERKGEAHAEVNALAAAGDRARGSTLFVTLEPCAHTGSTPPCAQAVIDAGVAKVVVGAKDPDPNAAGGLEQLRAAGVEAELADGELGFRARQQIEAWLTWVTKRRPFVTYKVAMTLDGRLTLPGSRWISGEESRTLVHELRAASDAVAVGMGTARIDRPTLTARGVGAPKQPRRLVFGSGPLPEDVDLELRSGPLNEELGLLAGEEVQSLLLEGGPTLATAFARAGLIDKLLVFVAPKLAGSGPTLFGELDEPVKLRRFDTRTIGEDVLLTAYVNEP
ncbi:MAG: bifunctional diaminohydroxyphosphoribosylaminopyrimidine deaminase/5-amino-6-(5-phosphoribosylamino)uracil reductase RibD [Actinobacteria bacterium]|nr:MAG: bifunctional diaminohydroxyphosphoribosylaminopyrimidine deaminase/5-amino-6-(5-phosphoribosylamino)uracil reductase RibD [Actinomycetota bacterium]